MNKPVFVFVECSNKIVKHDLPENFDGNMGNFIATIVAENNYPANIKVYVAGLA